MKIKLIALIIFISKLGCGQNDTVPYTKLCVETAPFSLIDLYGGISYRLGTEIKAYKNLSVYFEAGGYFPLKSVKPTDNIGYDGLQSDIKGYIAKTEIKFYMDGWSKGNYRSYLSLQGTLKNQSYDWTDSIKLKPAYVKTFTINKLIECIDFKYGQMSVYKSGIVLDWYVGVGVRFKNVTTDLTQAESNSITYGNDGDHDDLDYWMNAIGKAIDPDITLGLKIGYRIK